DPRDRPAGGAGGDPRAPRAGRPAALYVRRPGDAPGPAADRQPQRGSPRARALHLRSLRARALALPRPGVQRSRLRRQDARRRAGRALAAVGTRRHVDPAAHALAAWSPATADRITHVAVTGPGKVTVSGAFAWT